MEMKLCALFVVLAASAAYAYPAGHDKTDEVEFIPYGGRSQVPYFPADVDQDDGYFPIDFSASLEAMMRRMRNQLAEILRHLPTGSDGTSDHGINFPGIPNIDLNKGNTTSVTKFIDGHKVVINETEYKDAGENGAAFFKVRIIDVKPQDDQTTEKGATDELTSTPENREVEPIEDSVENEIPKTKETSNYDFDYGYEDIETFARPTKERRPAWDLLEPFDELDGNGLEGGPRDLSNDIYVNDLLERAGAPTNPDAEFIEGFEKERQRIPRRMRR